MPNKLSDVELDEISLVDRPANQKSRVVLFKRAGACTPEEEAHFKKVIRQEGSKWKLYSKDSKKELGEFDSREDAIARERQIQYFKHVKKMEDDAEEITKVKGVKFVIGFKEEGGSEIQSVLFDSEVWDVKDAKQWLKDHDMAVPEVDETSNYLRFRQKDPGGYKRMRIIVPGTKEVAKQSNFLSPADSYYSLMDALSRLVHEKYSPSARNGADPTQLVSLAVVKEIFPQACVIVLPDGALLKVAWEKDSTGKITLGNDIPVEMIYREIKKIADEVMARRVLTLRARTLCL
jgi:hypothetical protein